MRRLKTLWEENWLLFILALARLLLHLVTNTQYGFHRDELAVVDDARFLAWGYVAYPPVTPFIARVAVEWFGLATVGLRFFSALAQSISMVLTGLMARELGGSWRAQGVAAAAAAIAPMSLIMGAMFQYIAFDYLWWVAAAYCLIRLLKSNDPRWWLVIGAVLGLGMMTKYSMIFFIVGIVVAVLLTPTRLHLRSPWLWAGAVLSLLIFLPNLFWQLQNNFISLEFLSSIHERDEALGRTDGYFSQQFYVNANPFTLPLWLTGLYYYLFRPDGVRYRLLGWLYLIPLLLFFVAQGRFYYMAPAYPMLIAAGTVVLEAWLTTHATRTTRIVWGTTMVGLTVGAMMGGVLMLPIAPVNSAIWNINSQVHDNFVEQIGWPELVETITEIYEAQPDVERNELGILAGNYGEAGAINLLDEHNVLPEAISGINSYWARGYGDPPPETVIVVGFSRERAEQLFTSCELAGRITNRYGVANEETRFHPDIFLCRDLRRPWPLFWPEFRYFG